MKILIIEDEPGIRENIVDILEAENFKVLQASEGLEGVMIAKRFLPNLILCDIAMPKMNGFEVLTQLRSDSTTDNIPFIFLTAKNERQDFRKGMELGADDFITKPCTPQELLTAINVRLEKYHTTIQQFTAEKERVKELQRRVQELEQISNTTEELLNRLSEELRDPLSSINIAIKMIRVAPSEIAKERYLNILQQECEREMAILTQVTNLQELLSTDNVKLLHQFNLLKPKE